jgi:hypothetical protein
MIRPAAVLLLLFSTLARAEVDVASLYEVSTDGTTASFKAGQKGKLVIEIKTKEGSHISDEAPLSIELKGKDVAPEKAKLSLKDSVGQKKGDQKYADPRFEVALAGAAPAKGQVDAKLVFFVCTDKLCARQQKNLVLPVEVL